MNNKEAVIIFNPNAGGGKGEVVKKRIEKKAVELGWKGELVEMRPKYGPEEIIFEKAKNGSKHFVVCGGDGSVRQALKAICENKASLGIVPIGTGNILAKSLGISQTLEEAVTAALVGKERQIDVGKANGNYFVLVASTGVTTEAMRKTDKKMKSRFGMAAYFWSGFKALAKRSKKYKIIVDGKEEFNYRAKGIIVANIGRSVAGVEAVPGANEDSGDLKIGVVKANKLKSWIDLFINLFRGNVNNSPHYELIQGKKMKISSTSGFVRYDCDGDDMGKTENLEVEIIPKGITIYGPTSDVKGKLMEEKKKVLIFDFDGTIADTLSLLVKVFNNLAGKYGFAPVSEELIERYRGKSAREVIAELKIDPLKLPFIYSEGKKEFNNHMRDVVAFKNIKEVLTRLKGKYGLGIVTSNDTENVKLFLKANNLEIFDFVFSEKTLFGKGKIISDVLKEYKFDREYVMYVGDEIRDIDAARQADIRVMSVTWGFNTKEALAKHKPDYLVDSPEEMEKVLNM